MQYCALMSSFRTAISVISDRPCTGCSGDSENDDSDSGPHASLPTFCHHLLASLVAWSSIGSSAARYVCVHVYTCCSSSGFRNTNTRLPINDNVQLYRSYGTGTHTKLGRYSSSVFVIRVREDAMRPRAVAPTVWVTVVIPGGRKRVLLSLAVHFLSGRVDKCFRYVGLVVVSLLRAAQVPAPSLVHRSPNFPSHSNLLVDCIWSASGVSSLVCLTDLGFPLAFF
jgi:hypothetical protein